MTNVRQIRLHYERRGLRGAALRRALERHARILAPLDPKIAGWLRSEKVRGEPTWVGRWSGKGRPVGA